MRFPNAVAAIVAAVLAAVAGGAHAGEAPKVGAS